MISIRLRVTLTAIAILGVLMACTKERALGPGQSESRVFVDLRTGEFSGIVALDPTTWETVDSTSRYGNLCLLGASPDGNYIFGTGLNRLFKIDAHTLIATDSLAIATSNSNFLLVPEDGVILRATKAWNAVDDTLDIIETAGLSIRESRARSCFVLSWNQMARVVIGTTSYPWGDTVVLYDYERDSVLRSITLRWSTGLAMRARSAVMDHTRGRILAQSTSSIMVFELSSDSVIFEKSLRGDGLGNIIFSSNMSHIYVSDPGSLDRSSGYVYKFDADAYEVEASLETWQGTLPADDWLEPGQMVLSESGEELYIVSNGVREGPITVLDAQSLEYIHGAKLWSWPEQYIRSIVLID